MEICSHCKEMETTRKQVSDMYHIITGNGNPKQGLVFKVAKVEEHVDLVHQVWWKILAGAVGVPFTVLGGFILFFITKK